MFGHVCVFFAEPKKQGFFKFISVFNRNWQKGGLSFFLGGCPFLKKRTAPPPPRIRTHNVVQLLTNSPVQLIFLTLGRANIVQPCF